MANIDNLEFEDIIKIIGQIIFIIIIILVGYQIIRAILGGTWPTENIIIAGMGIIMGGLFVIVGFLINHSKTIGKIEERTRMIGTSLSNLGQDFKQHMEHYHNRK